MMRDTNQISNGVKAVIFDMDGVISDSQPLHAGLEELLLIEHGIEIPAAVLTRKYAGVPDRKCAEIIFSQYKKEVDLDDFVEKKWSRMMEFAPGRISAIEGALELIQKLKENNFKLAVASSSRLGFISLVLAELGIKDKFDSLTSGDEVSFGKPNPDIFLLAAKKLGVLASECWVIEDAWHGVIAAKRAGMKCVWLASKDPPGDKEYSSDIKVKKLTDLKVEDIT